MRILILSLTIGTVSLLSACGSSGVSKATPLRSVPEVRTYNAVQTGIASIYTDHRTASGERYSRHAMVCAHKTWPMGSKVKLTNLNNGRTAIVRINDRGPYRPGRVIDLTPAAAAKVGFGYAQGLAKVKIERVSS